MRIKVALFLAAYAVLTVAAQDVDGENIDGADWYSEDNKDLAPEHFRRLAGETIAPSAVGIGHGNHQHQHKAHGSSGGHTAVHKPDSPAASQSAIHSLEHDLGAGLFARQAASETGSEGTDSSGHGKQHADAVPPNLLPGGRHSGGGHGGKGGAPGGHQGGGGQGGGGQGGGGHGGSGQHQGSGQHRGSGGHSGSAFGAPGGEGFGGGGNHGKDSISGVGTPGSSGHQGGKPPKVDQIGGNDPLHFSQISPPGRDIPGLSKAKAVGGEHFQINTAPGLEMPTGGLAAGLDQGKTARTSTRIGDVL